MSFKQLLLRNVTRNSRSYATYFLSSSFSVLVFFLFALLKYHPQLTHGLGGSSKNVSELAGIGLLIAQYVIALMAFVFLWYTFSIFLYLRKKTFSIYMLLGATENDIRKMIFVENIVIGLSSTICGIFIGCIFAKLIFLITQNMLVLDQSLDFYFPIIPIVITSIVFMVAFLLISFITSIRIQTENLVDMTKSGEKPKPEPKATWYFSLLSIFMLILGYGGVLYFTKDNNATFLLFGVVSTIIATYFFYDQVSVRFLSYLKKKSIVLKKTNLLTISGQIFQIKENASMYFLISIVAAIAFVGIGTTLSVAGSDLASSQAGEFAYSYLPHNYNTEYSDESYHEKNLDKIEKIINREGYKTLRINIEDIRLPLSNEENNLWNQNTLFFNQSTLVIPLSLYNKIAAFKKEKKLRITNDAEVLLFSNTAAEKKLLKKAKESEKIMQLQFNQNAGTQMLNCRKIPESFSTGSISVGGVVSDNLYQELIEFENQDFIAEEEDFEQYRMRLTLIHYNEWQEGKEISRKVTPYLEKQEEINVENAEWKKVDGWEEPANKYAEQGFYYTSLYDSWMMIRQANGLILMISILIGAVFFTFAACILYFRLYGDLDTLGKYHRSLFIIGASEKDRHHIVRQEMLIMFFLPILVSALHFAVAMYALNLLSTFPVMEYYVKIVGFYFVFQLLFFLVSYKRYKIKLDKRAEG